MKFALSFLLVSVLVAACIQPPVYPDEPVIAYIGLNKNTIAQGSAIAAKDTLIVQFSFTDGDGDLSNKDSIDIFFTDNRQGAMVPYKLPLIAEEGTANGISGEVTVRILNQGGNICCLYSNGDNPCSSHPGQRDTFTYSIQIRDRADNYSNIIETDPIYILCD